MNRRTLLISGLLGATGLVLAGCKGNSTYNNRPGPFLLYGENWCPYCKEAKRLMDANGIGYEYREISSSEEWQQFMKDKGHTTIPQIYNMNTGEYVGGLQELIDIINNHGV